MTAHRFEPLPRARRTTAHLPWTVCTRCSLVALRNAATRAATRAPCPGADDPTPPPPPRR